MTLATFWDFEWILWLGDWRNLLTILQVVVGLGFVIFVHELGHFLVAKGCGVKCDKFYVGFDLFGLKFWKKQWGETEYGIGILPLGGYVKMLGQDDNPARYAKELERSRLQKEQAASGQPVANGEELPPEVLDPRSYLSKTVPQRMAIISAGVVMNTIFAFIFAWIAFGIGVPFLPCIVTEIESGSPAWKADLRVGDEFVEFAGVEDPKFTDLTKEVALSDRSTGIISAKIRRGGQVIPVELYTEPNVKHPKIGVKGPRTTTLGKESPVREHSAAAKATATFEERDRIARVGDVRIDNYPDLHRELARRQDEPLAVTVLRGGEFQTDGQSAGGSEVTIDVGPEPIRWLGLVMKIGPITAVQPNSPAANAKSTQVSGGLVAGDELVEIDGRRIAEFDPLVVADELRRRAGRTIGLKVSRQGHQQPLAFQVALRAPDAFEESLSPKSPASAPALGIAYRVTNVVRSVAPDGPAAKTGIHAGDEIVSALLIPAEGKTKKELSRGATDLGVKNPIAFDDENPNWSFLMHRLQTALPDTEVKLTLRRDDMEATISPAALANRFRADRGFQFTTLRDIEKAESFGDAIRLGSRETLDSLTLVVRVLRRIGDLLTSLGGPITIAEVAGYSAQTGVSTLLVFLTMLSANLAVINFLPIPVLDGGHMVFLTLEAIRGKPVSEKVFVAFQYVGLIFVLSLMIFVIGLDLGWIPRDWK